MSARWWCLLSLVLVGCGGVVSEELGPSTDAAMMDATPGSEFKVDSFVPPEPDTGPAWDAAAGDSPPTVSDCMACKLRNCDGTPCDADPICGAQRTCRFSCVDEACAARCREKYPSPVFDAWWTCFYSHCAAVCGL